MGTLTQVSRLLASILFLFSGIIKANDTIGFSYKLEEYFYIFGTEWLLPFSVPVAILICSIEIILGFSLLIGWGGAMVLWVFLLMCLFFSGLTFYSAYFNKVTDCGCFGDFLKLKPWVSFGKDAMLLVMGILMLAGKRNIRPVFSANVSKYMVIIVLIGSLTVSLYTLNYLPFWNFLPFKKGTDLNQIRTIPANTTAEEVQSKVFFAFTDSENKDRTDEFLGRPGYKFLLVAYNLEKSADRAWGKVNDFVALCQADSISFAGLTASPQDSVRSFRHEVQAMYDFYSCDETVLKSMVRSNPGVLLLKGAEIKEVWHYRTLPPYTEVKKKLMKD